MSFSHYPSYKDSGLESLGMIPKHWAVTLAKRFVTVKSGDMISSDEEAADGFPLIGGNGVRAYTTKWNTKGDTLVIGRVGARCGCVHHIKENFWASEHAYRVIEKQPLSKRFFFHLLSALELNRFAIKTAQPLLNTEIVESQWIPVPPLLEQDGIAVFLDRELSKIDELVAEQQRLIELLKEKRQAVISHAVTKGLNPDAPTKPSGIEWLGDVPKHWQVTRIANAFFEVAEAGADELPILSVSIHHGVSDKEIDEEDMDRKVTRSDDRSKYKRVASGDLVYNMMRAWQGGFGTVTVSGMVSPAYVVARPKTPLETTFVEHLLRTPQAVEEMRRHSRGVTDFRLRLYFDEFKNIRLALPPPEEAAEICTHIDEIEKKFRAMSAACEAAIVLLQERRSALISAAVTGQIDVRGLTEWKAA
jgi:type I restriction enzyme S subunit